MEGVSIVTSRGQTSFTDIDGNAKITFYTNTKIGGSFARKLHIFAYTSGFCGVTFLPSQIKKDVKQNQINNNNNNNNNPTSMSMMRIIDPDISRK